MSLLHLRYNDASNPTSLEMVEIDGSGLDKMQECVGGLIEPVFTVCMPGRPSHLLITGYANEEARLFNLPELGGVFDEHGARSFAGQMVITGLNDKTGESRELTQAEKTWVKRAWQKNWLVLETIDEF